MTDVVPAAPAVPEAAAPAVPQIPPTAAEVLQFTHLTVLAAHVESLKQAFMARVAAEVKAIHISSIVDHALALAASAEADVKTEVAKVEAKAASSPGYKAAALAVLAVVVGSIAGVGAKVLNLW